MDDYARARDAIRDAFANASVRYNYAFLPARKIRPAAEDNLIETPKAFHVELLGTIQIESRDPYMLAIWSDMYSPTCVFWRGYQSDIRHLRLKPEEAVYDSLNCRLFTVDPDRIEQFSCYVLGFGAEFTQKFDKSGRCRLINDTANALGLRFFLQP